MALIGASNSLGGLSGSNTVARLLVVISGDSTSLSAALGKTEASLKGFQANASAIGSALTRTITLPFLAIGGAAIKAATDFNTALTRVAALTPVLDKAKGGIAGLEDQILSLANQPDIVATPTDLADALYFAGSAGLKTAQAFNVVELAAKGQSVGMGDAADIAKVLIFAMNNYQSEGLKAADAMDALTAAVREGTAEPADLAVALGRLLPIAHQAGVTFNEVVASVAALTNLGVPARVATTSLRALFGGLLAPTQAATDALKTLGITADQLRYKLQQGPLEAFQAITDATQGNADATRLIIPQIRAITAFYGLAGTQAQRYKAVLDAVNHSQGTLSKVITQFEKTPGFQFKKLLQQLQIAGIELGDALIPTFLKLIDIIGNMVKVFQGIPDLGKQFVAGFLVIGSLIGPLTKLYGIITAFGTSGVASAKALTTGFVTMGIAAAAAVGGFLSLAHGSKDLFSVMTTLIGSLIAVKIALTAITEAAAARFLTSGGLIAGILGDVTAPQITAIAVAVGVLATAVAYFAGKSERAAKDSQNLADILKAGFKSGGTLKQAFDDGGALSSLSQEVKNVATGMGLLNSPLSKAATILQAGFGGTALHDIHQLRLEMDGLNPAALKASVSEETIKTITQLDDALQGTGSSIQAVSIAWDKFGVGSPQTIAALNDVIQGTSGSLKDHAQAIESAISEYQDFRTAIDNYNQDQIAALRLSQMNETAIKRFAQQTGTSVDYISQAVSSSGFVMAGASKQALDAFKRTQFGINKAGDLISGSVAEARDEVAKAATDMATSFDQMFQIFEKPPKLSDGPDFGKFLDRLKTQSQQAVQLATDIQTLSAKGVPGELIQRLIDQGPSAVHKFAEASRKELQKYVGYFETYLGAGDDEVIKEGLHLETKGSNNIQNFVTGMLKEQSLTRAAARTIVGTVTNEAINGNLDPAGLNLILSFVKGLKNGPKLTAKEADKLTFAFIKEIHDKHNFTKDGKLIIQRVAKGMAQVTGLPKAVIVEALSGLGTTLRTTGTDALVSFIEGMQAQKTFAKGSVNNIVTTVTAAFLSGDLSAAGLELINSFVDGIKNGSRYAISQGGALTEAFIAEIRDKHNYNADGILLMKRVAQGISDATGIPLKQVQAMLVGVRSTITADKAKLQVSGTKIPVAIERGINAKLDTLKDTGHKTGKAFMTQFGAGVADGLTSVIITVQNAAADIVAVFDAFLHASPQYASYHMGVQWVEDFNKGLHHARLDTGLIENFVAAMFQQRSLTRNAGRQIIGTVTSEVLRGDLQPSAVKLIQSFVTGLEDGPPLSARAADKLTVAFVKELHDKHNFTQDGKLIIGQVINGMAQTTNLPKSVIRGALTGLSNTLAEGGAKSIKAFAAGIRGQKNISKGSANQIIGVVTQALLSGKLKPAGASLVTDFVAGLAKGPPKARREAGKVTRAFVRALTNKHNYDRDGVLIMDRVAQGISTATHIPIKQVNQMLGGVALAVRDKQIRLTQAGAKIPVAIATGMDLGLNALQAAGHKAGSTLMGSFAQGVREHKKDATTAAANAAQDINKAFESHLHASPQYASFHYGVKWIEQFNEGMHHAKVDTKIPAGFGLDSIPKPKPAAKHKPKGGGFGLQSIPKPPKHGFDLFMGETKKGMKGYNATLKKGLHDGDNAVLNEGKHLKNKGKKNMHGFIGGVVIGGKHMKKAAQDVGHEAVKGMHLDLTTDGAGAIKSWTNGWTQYPWKRDADGMMKQFHDALRKGPFRDDGQHIAKELLSGFNDGKDDLTKAMHLGGSRRHQTPMKVEHRLDGRQHHLHSATAARPHKSKLDVKLSVDRRKFTDGLTYDSTYRGW